MQICMECTRPGKGSVDTITAFKEVFSTVVCVISLSAIHLVDLMTNEYIPEIAHTTLNEG